MHLLMRARHTVLFALIVAGSAASAASAAGFAERWAEIRQTATPTELYTLLYALPKGGDLHNHLGGSGLPEWWFALATDKKRNGGQTFYTRTRILNVGPSGMDWRGRNIDTVYWVTIRESAWKKLPEANRAEFKALEDLTPAEKKEWLDSVRLDRPGEGRDEFFEFTWVRLNHLVTDAHCIPEILVENMKAFGAEGLLYLETQAPAFGLSDPDGRIVPGAEMAVRYEARLAQADAQATGVTVRFQASVLRFAPIAEAEVRRAYAFLAAYPGRWVGINMGGREDNDKGYPLRFLKVYREMRREYPGIGISIHGGEVDEPNAHVRDTLLLGATRIGHGYNLITDPDTMLLMRNSRFMVEINLVSNQLLEYTSDIQEHPFPEYLRFGIPVSLNTDDRGMWDSNMTDEYFTAVKEFKLSWAEVVQLGRASLEFSFTPAEVKARLLAAYDENVAAFETRYGTADWRVPLRAVKPVAYGYTERTWNLKFD